MISTEFFLGFGAGKAAAGGGGGGGSDIDVESLSVSANGTYNAPTGKAYSPVEVDVPNTYAAGDEGKVVNNGALVAQTAHAKVTQNGTIDTTLNDSVEIDVPTGAGVDVEALSVTANGTYTAPEGKAYSPVTVNVSGGGGEVPKKDVNFIDYDGTVLYSYTAQEAAALDALPANPSHTGLTAQGWNYTLAQMKTQITALGKCDIGQMYVTDDGKTRLYIHIPEGTTGDGLTFYVRYTQSTSQGVTVDWGDGNSETFTGTSAANRSHTYAAAGDYVITLKVTSGTVSFVGSASNVIFGSTGATNGYNRSRIYKAEIGANVTNIGNYTFDYCYALKSITIPSGVTSIGNYAFQYCYTLNSIAIPNSVTSIGDDAFQYCYTLNSITIPSSVTSIGSYAFDSCYVLNSITIPSSVTRIASYAFNYCYALKSLTIPSEVTSIGSNTFRYCYALESITIPSSVASIEQYAFNSDYSLREIHFKSDTPPTVANSNAWTSIASYCKIYVPAGKLSAYTSATNYPSPSTYTYVEESA